MEKNERINQVKTSDSEIKKIDLHLVEVCKSICKITFKNISGTGFFIKLHIDDKKLFCLMTNHHVVTKEMIDSLKSKFAIFDILLDISIIILLSSLLFEILT